MNKKDLQEYIEQHIPITKSLNFEIKEIQNANVKIACFYKDHINHKNSVFGGSISSLMTLTGWAKVKIIMESIDSRAEIVIQEGNSKFLKPVLNDFEAISISIDEKVLEKCTKMYKKFGRSRIKIKIILKEIGKEEILSEFEGLYVVINKKTKF